MGFIDIVLLVIIGAFILFGFFFGFVHTLGSLIGSMIGIFLSTRLIDPVFDRFGFMFGGGQFGRIVLFIIVFFIISRLIGILFWFFGKIWDVLSFIPFAKTIDRFLGAIFGLVEGLVVIGVVIFYAMQVLPKDTLLAALQTSEVANYLVAMVSALQVLLPEGLRTAKEATEQSTPS